MRTHGSLLTLLMLGCVADNPDYRPRPGPAPASEDLTQEAPDLAGPPDDVDLSKPPDPAGCQPGQRSCRTVGSVGEIHISQGCRDGAWVDDRRCPQGSLCQDGYCLPPPREGTYQGKECSAENDCFPENLSSRYSCQPFVQLPGKEIQTYCAQVIGEGLPGTPCMAPFGGFCRTGLCDENTHSRRGRDQSFCYRMCEDKDDCPYRDRFTCEDAVITVEGVSYSAGKSCIPR